ncbi:MAG: sulfatase [Halobacteriota archaeon]|nr:sulfatase [Halobacteriota archaeon]
MRNIVLITFDSLRADHCGFMGYRRETTPTIDKMAKSGLNFKNAIVSGVPTPVSMVGTFTGDYSYIDPSSLESKHWRREIAARKTLPQVLGKKGYSTGAIHENERASSYFGFDKGFEYYNDFHYEGARAMVHDRLLIPLFKRFGFSQMMPDMIVGMGTSIRWENLYDFIIDWVKRAKEPFFLWVLLLDTHIPYVPPMKFRRHSNFFKIYYYNWKIGQSIRTKAKADERWRKIIDPYDDAIRYADDFVDRLWEDIKGSDPLFILHADHGDGFFEHGSYFHDIPFSLYEELIHVPLVIYNGDLKGKIEEPVSLLGLSPTILDLIGEENEFSSESFLNGGSDYVISKIFVEGRRKLSVRMKEWKFITGQKKEDELYFLNNDPYEQENIINEHPDLYKEMIRIVEGHIKQEMELRRIRERISRLRV